MQTSKTPSTTPTTPKLSKYYILRNFFSDYRALKRAFPFSKNDLLLHRAQKSRRNKQLTMERQNEPEPEPAQTPLAQPNGVTETVSKRQRLLGIARATRDTYIPKLAGSMSQLASDVSSRMSGGDYSSRDLYDEHGRLKFPKDTSIMLYDTYTRVEGSTYFVDVRGWLWCPGVMTRKNRLILSLAKQITKYNVNPAGSSQAVEKWESDSLQQDILDDSESINSDASSLYNGSPGDLNRRPTLSASSTSSSLSLSNEGFDGRIKERMSQFIARSIPNSELEIVIGSESLRDNVSTTRVITNANGHFELTIAVDYVPSIVQVRAVNDESIFCFKDIMLIADNGIGLISDIDDTIKLTGVIGDKRLLMTSLLTKDVSEWLIPSMCKWYNNMFLLKNISFHYVSNSPWQLYGVIKDFMAQGKLPAGSIHLKQYTGNIISSLMEPSKSRKSSTLDKLLRDFKHKKFICIGDSGEYDFEAYVDLAVKNPGRILAIYIRYVENSMSDVDDSKILKEVLRVIDKHKARQEKRGITRSKTLDAYQQPDLIDLSDTPSKKSVEREKKLPPIKPMKPDNLKVGRKPPVPERSPLRKTHNDTDIRQFNKTQSEVLLPLKSEIEEANEPAPPLTPMRPPEYGFPGSFVNAGNSYDLLSENLHDVYSSHDFYELEDMDSKGYQWVTKVNGALAALKNSPVEIHIFKDDEDAFFETSLMSSKEALASLKNIVKEN